MWKLNDNTSFNYYTIHNDETLLAVPVGRDKAKAKKIVRMLNNHSMKNIKIESECLEIEFDDTQPIIVNDVYARETMIFSQTPKFRLGLDIHGVIDKDVEFFRKLAKDVIDSGGEVHILTGSSLTNKEHMDLFKSYQIPHTHMFSITDYLLDTGHQLENDSTVIRPWFPDEVWNPVKAQYCAKYDISLHYDDSTEYARYFSTPYVLYKKEH